MSRITRQSEIEDASRFLRNVNRLSIGGASQRANHRKYGTVRITESCDMSEHGVRRFSVSGSRTKRLHNGGHYTLGSIRRHILGTNR